MIVHPPVHYFLIGLLMRLGFTLYYAQATPTLLMALLCIWLILRGPFSAPVEIGLLYGLWVSMAVFGRFHIELFGMRPEGQLGVAWLASLILLERRGILARPRAGPDAMKRPLAIMHRLS